MHFDVESSDRTAADYLKFGLAFVGTLFGAWGVILSSVFLALAGGALVLLCTLALQEPED
jgi:hypothetical protein